MYACAYMHPSVICAPHYDLKITVIHAMIDHEPTATRQFHGSHHYHAYIAYITSLTTCRHRILTYKARYAPVPCDQSTIYLARRAASQAVAAASRSCIIIGKFDGNALRNPRTSMSTECACAA